MSESSALLAADSIPRIVHWSVVGLTIAVLAVFACFQFPAPRGDEQSYIPPVINLARGKGLTNEYWWFSRQHDPTEMRLVYHGFFYQFLLGQILPRHSPNIALLTVIPIITILLAILSSSLFVIAATRLGTVSFGWKQCVGCVLALWAQLSLILAFGARPELGAALVTVIVALFVCYFRDKPVVADIALGLGAGIAAAMSPLSGGQAALIIAMYCAFRFAFLTACKHLGISGIVAMVSFFCIFRFFYPYPLADWMRGVQAHSAIATGGSQPAYWISELLLSPLQPGIGVVLLIVVLNIISLTRTEWSLVGALPAWMILIVVFVGSTYYYCLASPFRVYNILSWITIALGLILYNLASHRPSTWLSLASLSALAVLSLGFFRLIPLFVVFLGQGVRVADAQNRLKELELKERETVGCWGCILYLFDDLHALRAIEPRIQDSQELGPEIDVLIIPQASSGRLSPPLFDGFDMIANHFLPDPPRLWGIRLGNSIPGFAFAAYRKRQRAIDANVP